MNRSRGSFAWLPLRTFRGVAPQDSLPPGGQDLYEDCTDQARAVRGRMAAAKTSPRPRRATDLPNAARTVAFCLRMPRYAAVRRRARTPSAAWRRSERYLRAGGDSSTVVAGRAERREVSARRSHLPPECSEFGGIRSVDCAEFSCAWQAPGTFRGVAPQVSLPPGGRKRVVDYSRRAGREEEEFPPA